MYLSQARIEGNLLSIQKQIDETVAGLCNILKGYQLEINFNQSQTVDEDTGEIVDASQSVHRGSKSFIEQMKQKNKDQQTEIDFQQELTD
jgi:hypothetical protein